MDSLVSTSYYAKQLCLIREVSGAEARISSVSCDLSNHVVSANKKGDGREPCSRCEELESACTYGKNTTFIARGMLFQKDPRFSLLIQLPQNGAQWRPV